MGEDAARTEDDRLSRVGDAALNELLYRLEDPEAAKELPGTGLLNIANAYTKLQEKRLERDALKSDGPVQDDVDIILASPLPDDRKRELLADAYDKAVDKAKRIREQILKLEGVTDER